LIKITLRIIQDNTVSDINKMFTYRCLSADPWSLEGNSQEVSNKYGLSMFKL